MITIDKKKFLGFDALGTDGTNDADMAAIYQVIDSDGFTYAAAHIPVVVHKTGTNEEIDVALVTLIS